MNRNGIALFVLMFAVLSLSIFSLISYTSSRADNRTAEAGAKLFEAYYEADTLAERVMDELVTEGTVPANVLGLEIKTEQDVFTGTDIVSFAAPVLEEQELYVEAALSPGGYEIRKWKLRSIGDWETDDDNLPVWQGEEEETINTGLPSWLTD